MQKSLLWESIRSLSGREKSSLMRFLSSPYFNMREDSRRLASFLLEYDQPDAPPKADVFRAVFGDEPYDDTKMRLQMSYLQKKIEDFWAIEYLRSDPYEWLWGQYVSVHRRDLPKNTRHKNRELDSRLARPGPRGGSYYLNRYRVIKEQHDRFFSASVAGTFDYESPVRALDIFYTGSKLRYACMAMLYRSVYDTRYRFEIPEDLLRKVEENAQLMAVPFISLYYRFFRLMQRGTSPEFSKLREDFLASRSLLPEDELREVYTMIRNFYVRHINSGRMDLVPEALAFYQLGLDLDLLMENGVLTGFTYSNIVAMALKTGDIEWVARFIEQYRDHLPRRSRAETYSLNRARLEYQLKNYDSALKLLRQLTYKDIFRAVTSRILQLKIYWELFDVSLLLSHSYAFQRFLKRKEIIGYHYQLWNKAATYFQKLARVNPYDKSEVRKLLTAIQKEKVLAEKEWFVQQLRSMLHL